MKYLKTIILTSIILCFFSSCKKELDMSLVKSTLSEGKEFISVHAEEAFEIQVIKDENTFVEMECSAYLNDYIICKVENDCLTLSVDKTGSLPTGTVYRAVVHTPTLQSITLTEAAKMTIKGDFEDFTSAKLSKASTCSGGVFSGDKIKITLSDASQCIDFTFDGQQCEAQLTDASRFVGNVNVTDSLVINLTSASTLVNYGGTSETAILELTENSLVNMAQTEIRKLEADISEVSSATVRVDESISGHLTGISTLYYYGNAALVPDFVCDTTSFVVKL